MQEIEKRRKPEDFAPDFDKLDELVSKIMERMAPELPKVSEKPVVFGFSMRLGSDGKPVIEEFGNILKKSEKPLVSKAREPLVDVNVTKNNVLITVELPGVDKKDLRINVPDQHTVEVVVAGNNSFYKKILLPAEIVMEKIDSRLKNGILEASFERKQG